MRAGCVRASDASAREWWGSRLNSCRSPGPPLPFGLFQTPMRLVDFCSRSRSNDKEEVCGQTK